MFIDVTAFVDAGRRGFSLFTSSVLPVLFPFFFITSFMIESGIFSKSPRFISKAMQRIYKVDGKVAPVFILGLVAGYPTSARMLSELVNQGEISKQDAIRASTFTSITSPIFIIATVGASLYSDVRFGVLVFAAIAIGALINGFLYRSIKFKTTDTTVNLDNKAEQKSTSDALMSSLQSSIQAIMMVGGLVVLFFILGSQIDTILNLSHIADIVLSSILEMTRGIFLASSYPNLTTMLHLVMATAILSFGGLCIGMQGFLFFKKFGMPFWFYLLYKFSHMILSIGIVMLLALVF